MRPLLNPNFTSYGNRPLTSDRSGRCRGCCERQQSGEFVMRVSSAYVATLLVATSLIGPAHAQAQKGPKLPVAPFVTGSIPAPETARTPAPAGCTNPNALGVARVVEIDTTGGPGFGFEH